MVTPAVLSSTSLRLTSAWAGADFCHPDGSVRSGAHHVCSNLQNVFSSLRNVLSSLRNVLSSLREVLSNRRNVFPNVLDVFPDFSTVAPTFFMVARWSSSLPRRSYCLLDVRDGCSGVRDFASPKLRFGGRGKTLSAGDKLDAETAPLHVCCLRSRAAP